jgi:hypothetical protein
MAELIKISKATNTNVAIVEFRDLFTSGAVTTKEVRVEISNVSELRNDGRTLTVTHPGGEYTFKPDQVDYIDGNTWGGGTPWDFATFYNHILTFLGWM